MLLDNGRRRGVEVVVSLDGRPARLGRRPARGGAAGDPRRGVRRGRRRRARRPALRRGRARGAASIRPTCTSSRGRAARSSRARPRLARAISWVRRDDHGDNPYSRPLYGLVAVVDLDDMRVLRVDDHAPGTPPPSGEWRRLPRRRRAAVPHRPAPDRDHPARGPELRPRRPPPGLAAVGPAHRLPPARGPRAARHRLRRRRRAAADLPPRLDRRARHPLRRPQPDRRTSRTCSTPASTASGRSRTRCGSAATASARSPTSTASRTHWSGDAARRSRTRSASTRRTRTCSGSTPTTTPAASTGPARAGS